MFLKTFESYPFQSTRNRPTACGGDVAAPLRTRRCGDQRRGFGCGVVCENCGSCRIGEQEGEIRIAMSNERMKMFERKAGDGGNDRQPKWD